VSDVNVDTDDGNVRPPSVMFEHPPTLGDVNRGGRYAVGSSSSKHTA
jgi:hypothetical protein